MQKWSLSFKLQAVSTLTLSASNSADAASLVAHAVQPGVAGGVLLSGIIAACGQARLAQLPQRAELAWSVYELANAKRLTLSKEAQVALWDTQAVELSLVVQPDACMPSSALTIAGLQSL